MARRPKGPVVPSFQRCGGCGRNLDTRTYHADKPQPDVPDSRVTWYVIQPPALAYTVMCPNCSHYTVHWYWPRNNG